jgi:acyl carrier protein
MSHDDITEHLITFIQDNLVGADAGVTVDEATPLLQLGILNSLKTAMLLNYVRDELHAPIPPERLSAGNFATPKDISALVQEVLAVAPQPS